MLKSNVKTLFCDCQTDALRAEFFRSGRAVETGIVAPAIADIIAAAFEARSHLASLVSALESLMDESQGVAGLHQNGDIASWSELCAGGEFGGWLSAFDEARDFMEDTTQEQAAPPIKKTGEFKKNEFISLPPAKVTAKNSPSF